MENKKIIALRSIVCSAKLSCLLLFFLLLTGCSSPNKQFSYFNMLEEQKRTTVNKQAAEKFWASVRPVSTLSDSHYRLGRHYQQKGKYEKSINEFEKALRNDPSYCKAHNGIAMSYDALKRCQPAHNAYKLALQCAPDEAYVYNNYGCSNLLCGDYSRGVELLSQAERLAERNTRIKNNLIIAHSVVNKGNLSNILSARQKPIRVPEPEPAALMPMNETPTTNLIEELPLPLHQTISSDVIVTNNFPIDNTPSPPAELPIIADEKTDQFFTVAEAKEEPVSIKFLAVKTKRILSPKLTSVAVEVSNGNGTTGMAGRSAEFLRSHGFEVKRITNAQHFHFEESVIFYREGYLQTAQEIAAIIPGSQDLRKIDAMGKGIASVGVRVLLGRDLIAMRFPESFSGVAECSGHTNEYIMQNSVAIAVNSVQR